MASPGAEHNPPPLPVGRQCPSLTEARAIHVHCCPHRVDNCPDVPNKKQADFNLNGVGNACETTGVLLVCVRVCSTVTAGEGNQSHLVVCFVQGVTLPARWDALEIDGSVEPSVRHGADANGSRRFRRPTALPLR
jgi:hypothetical protein